MATIKSIDKLDAKIREYFGTGLICKDDASAFGRGGYVYLARAKEKGNVYRIFCDDMHKELIFQTIADVFYVKGCECYDDAYDYKWTKWTTKTPIDRWFDLVVKWVKECEADEQFTKYDETNTKKSMLEELMND